MNDLQSSSFIPKRGPGKKPTVSRASNLIILPIISYSMFVSAPLAAAAVFIYQKHTENLFNSAVVGLDEAITSFQEPDMKRVVDFDRSVTTSKNLLHNHVSIKDLFTLIENSTSQTAKFNNVKITRDDDAVVTITGDMSASEFDGALFQRSLFNAAEKIQNLKISDVTIAPTEKEDPSAEKVINLTVAFDVSVSDVAYSPESTTESIIAPVDVASSTVENTPKEVVQESNSINI